MDIIVSVTTFLINATFWAFANWKIVLAVIAIFFLWVVLSPVLAEHNTKVQRDRVRNRVASSRLQELEVENQRYPQGHFDFDAFISNIDSAPREREISDEFNQKFKNWVSASERGDYSDPDSPLFSQIKSDFSKNAEFLNDPASIQVMFTARSRLVQVWACQLLMLSYFHGSKGFIQDYGKSYEYAKKIENVCPTAIYVTGFLYLKGYYLEQDYRKAWEYLICSAICRDAEAHDLLGDMYRDGLGVVVDQALAFAFYNIACSLRHDKEDWRHKRDSFSRSLPAPILNKGHSLASNILDSNYHKLVEICLLQQNGVRSERIIPTLTSRVRRG
jgi:TPR repeat protein